MSIMRRDLTKEEMDIILHNLKSPEELHKVMEASTGKKVARFAGRTLTVATGLVIGLFVTVLVNTKPANEYDSYTNLGVPYCEHEWVVNDELSTENTVVYNCTDCTAQRIELKEE